MNKFLFLYKFFSFSNFLNHTIRYFIYRKAVLEPADLILLHKSETAYHKIAGKNKSIKKKINNPVKRIGFLGQLSQSMLLNKNFWSYPIPKDVKIYLYELSAEGYPTDPRLTKYNHEIYEGFWHESKYDRVYKDTFDYNKIASKINADLLDVLIITIETLGRFTYGELLNLIVTDTKIIVTNPGNYPYFHPKIHSQGQIQLPPCWMIKNQKLIHSSNYVISDYKFLERFFFYDRRDLNLIDGKINYNYENIIFIHGRLSLVADASFLNTVEKLLLDDPKRKLFLMGINDQNSLKYISDFFKKSKAKNQYKYLGAFYMKFNENGKLNHKNWDLTKQYLKSSALFLNPFPRGAGSARMEAFISGLPVIDLEIDYMNPKEKSKKEYILKPLIKKYGTAYSEDEYYNLALKAINDIDFRESIIKEQYAIAKEFFYESFFWEKIKTVLYES